MYARVKLIRVGIMSIRFLLVLDFISIVFLVAVRLISLSVLVFSSSYMIAEKFYSRFTGLVLLFILSMVLLILRPNLISILFGWDGLGISSYLLVIYYGREKAYNAGILTALTNRLGDGLILFRIGRLVYLGDYTIG